MTYENVHVVPLCFNNVGATSVELIDTKLIINDVNTSEQSMCPAAGNRMGMHGPLISVRNRKAKGSFEEADCKLRAFLLSPFQHRTRMRRLFSLLRSPL